LNATTYTPPLLFRNPHINTIYTAIFKKTTAITYQRERIKTLDQDFLDLDFSLASGNTIVLVIHGLEGSSESSYVRRFTHSLNEEGYNVCAMNLRSCSGELNTLFSAYHSGKTDDVEAVIDYLYTTKKYNQIHIIGFSLGGNLCLKYMGEQHHPYIKSALAVSVPCDLRGSSIQMSQAKNKIYATGIMNSLKNKLKQKVALCPTMGIEMKDIQKIKSFHDFDNLYTAPFHGFKDADDYYEKNSSKYFIKNIKTPTLLINALDDPFLSESCYPYHESKENAFFTFEYPNYGGHVGFYAHAKTWIEKRAIDFLKFQNQVK